MQYPYPITEVSTTGNTVALQANVSRVVNAIKTNSVIPYGDYGGSTVYYFSTMDNGLGNIIYTVFDKTTTLGLASYMVRYGAATTIYQILFQPFPRAQVDLRYLILPQIPLANTPTGTIIPY